MKTTEVKREELKSCKELLFFYRVLAKEKCRVSNMQSTLFGGRGAWQSYLHETNGYYSESYGSDCKRASQAVIEQAEKCLQLKKS